MKVSFFQGYAFGLAGIGFALSFSSSGAIAAAGAFVGAGLFAVADALNTRSAAAVSSQTADPK